MLRRVFAALILLTAVLFLPYWLFLPLTIVLMFYFDKYIEAPIALLLSDLLYGTADAKVLGLRFFSFTLGIVLFATIEILKKKLKFYAHKL